MYHIQEILLWEHKGRNNIILVEMQESIFAKERKEKVGFIISKGIQVKRFCLLIF